MSDRSVECYHGADIYQDLVQLELFIEMSNLRIFSRASRCQMILFKFYLGLRALYYAPIVSRHISGTTLDLFKTSNSLSEGIL